MKYLSEFRDPILADKLVNELKKDVGLLSSGNNVRIMEVCGGTHILYLNMV